MNNYKNTKKTIEFYKKKKLKTLLFLFTFYKA